MKSWISFAFLLFVLPFSAMAIEEVRHNNDGSITYRCEFAGSNHLVQVKYMGKGNYLVLRRGSAAQGLEGRVQAPSAVEAGKLGCGE